MNKIKDYKKAPRILVRPYADTDENFILNSWMKSLKQVPPWAWTKDQVYYDGMTKRIRRKLKRAGAVIACDPRNPNVILGWMCAEWVVLGAETEPIVHYVYIKYAFREYGIYNIFYDLISEKKVKIPWTTENPLRSRHPDKGGGLNVYPMRHESYRPHTYNPFILDVIEELDTIPCSERITIEGTKQ